MRKIYRYTQKLGISFIWMIRVCRCLFSSLSLFVFSNCSSVNMYYKIICVFLKLGGSRRKFPPTSQVNFHVFILTFSLILWLTKLCVIQIYKCLGTTQDHLGSCDNWASLCVTKLAISDVLKSCNKIYHVCTGKFRSEAI